MPEEVTSNFKPCPVLQGIKHLLTTEGNICTRGGGAGVYLESDNAKQRRVGEVTAGLLQDAALPAQLLGLLFWKQQWGFPSVPAGAQGPRPGHSSVPAPSHLSDWSGMDQ